MPKSNQDYTAWRFQSFDTENNGDGYDCELPSTTLLSIFLLSYVIFSKMTCRGVGRPTLATQH